jgi:hypothetical protein
VGVIRVWWRVICDYLYAFFIGFGRDDGDANQNGKHRKAKPR